jgi:hypothetical protein
MEGGSGRTGRRIFRFRPRVTLKTLWGIRGTGSIRAEIYSSVLYAMSTHDLDAGHNIPGS